MSIVSTNHDVVNFDAKKSSALTGQRLSKIIYRTREGKEEKQSKCVSVPQIALPEVIINSNLAAIVLESLHSYQDKIIKCLVDSGKTQIADAEISIDAIVSYQAEEPAGSRLTKDLIASWFDSSVSDMLTIAISEKLGVSEQVTPEEEIRVLAIVGEYKNKFSSLAGGKTSYAPDVAVRLEKALEIAGTNDDISEKLKARLQGMKVVQSNIMLDL